MKAEPEQEVSDRNKIVKRKEMFKSRGIIATDCATTHLSVQSTIAAVLAVHYVHF